MNVFDEFNRRLFVGFLSSSLGRGGDKYISKITGLDMKNIRKGRNELVYGDKILKNRVRRVGGGRYIKEKAEKEYMKELFSLIDDYSTGNPMNDSRWVRRTLRWIKSEIQKKGIKVSISTIRKTLIGSKISLKKNIKTKSTQSHPLRNDQFLYLNKKKKEFLATGKPVISIDTKKKKLIGNFKNPDKTCRKRVYETLDHDLPSLAEG